MRIEAIDSTGHSRAIVIFCGWAMDATPLRELHRPGYDILAIYDYRDQELHGDIDLDTYEEICIVAWSWGVPSAARFIDTHRRLPITACIAVNGTLTPIDDTLGIPRPTFEGTLAGLTDRSLLKFYRRICRSAEEFAAFKAVMPSRAVEELADELRAIDRCGAADLPATVFDHVVISGADAIIPPANQHNAWRGHPMQEVNDGGHLPDFQSIIDRLIHDKSLVTRRFGGAASTYDSQAEVQRHVARRILSLWVEAGAVTGGDIIEIGPGTGYFTRLYTPRLSPASLRLIDLSPAFEGVTAADGETAIRHLPDSSADAVVSTSTIQWFNSPARFLRECHRVLRRGGMAVITTFARGHFAPLEPFITSPISYYSTEGIRQIIPEGLSVVHLSEESVNLTFSSAREMLRHLSDSGVNAVASTASPAAVRRIINGYPRNADGSVTLPYRPLLLILRKD